MDQGVIKISCAENARDVSVYHRVNKARPRDNQMSPVIICMPSPFPFKNTKVVPWQYDVTTIVNGQEECVKKGLKKLRGSMSQKLQGLVE